ncbi:MAG: MBL fold metallo-hydrolase [Planctomycetota bacterium]
MDYCILLGTAQDGGIPQVGCDCEQCTAARKNSELRRKVASLGIILEDENKIFVIDATPDFPSQADYLRLRLPGRESANPVDGIFITHLHLGHYTGLLHLGRESCSSKMLPVYATFANGRFLESQKPFSHLVERGEIEIRELAGESVSIGRNVSVTPFHVRHRNEDGDTVGFAIRGGNFSIVYLPDLDEWDEAAEQAVRRADVAIVDGTFSSADEVPSRDGADVSHPPIPETRKRFEDASVRLVFTHFNHTNPLACSQSRDPEKFPL